MITVTRPTTADVEDVVRRIGQEMRALAASNALICPTFNENRVAAELSGERTLVARRAGTVLGHLAGAVVTEGATATLHVPAGGATFRDAEVLGALYVARTDGDLSSGVRHQAVWSAPGPASRAWLELGFALARQRGAAAIGPFPTGPPPPGYRLRRGEPADLPAALALDARHDEEAARGPTYLAPRGDSEEERRRSWTETIEDPETNYVVIDGPDAVVAHGCAFALPPAIGSFPSTVYLTGIYVDPEHRRRGLARALADHLLNAAARRGADHAEITWRTTDHGAARYWRNYGFAPTLVGLARTLPGA